MPILETIAATGLGAVVGFIEKPIAQFMDLKAKKEENRHVEALQGLQHAHELVMADKELLGEGIKADATTLTASYVHDSSPENTSKWVNNIRALVRPASVLFTFIGTLYEAEVFLPSFMLCLTWYFASRVRPTFPK